MTNPIRYSKDYSCIILNPVKSVGSEVFIPFPSPGNIHIVPTLVSQAPTVSTFKAIQSRTGDRHPRGGDLTSNFPTTISRRVEQQTDGLKCSLTTPSKMSSLQTGSGTIKTVLPSSTALTAS
eukprot:GFUD01067287.1.p1 GENE.GFUD01067287.1~~GFUD01067287.1.p1  ORF type:complete len:122 (-),score=1.71 GFUD01067287.1:521-886(-)